MIFSKDFLLNIADYDTKKTKITPDEALKEHLAESKRKELLREKNALSQEDCDEIISEIGLLEFQKQEREMFNLQWQLNVFNTTFDRYLKKKDNLFRVEKKFGSALFGKQFEINHLSTDLLDIFTVRIVEGVI